MINAKLNLYIFIYDQVSQRYLVVSTNPDTMKIPSVDLSAEDNMQMVLKKTFEQHVMLSSQYVTFKISNTDIRDGILNIDYYALGPFTAKTQTGSFLLPAQEYVFDSQNIQQIVSIL